MLWAELIIVVIVLGFAFQQLHAVKKAQRERREREAAEKSASLTQADDAET